jgi:hypothetical protein
MAASWAEISLFVELRLSEQSPVPRKTVTRPRKHESCKWTWPTRQIRIFICSPQVYAATDRDYYGEDKTGKLVFNLIRFFLSFFLLPAPHRAYIKVGEARGEEGFGVWPPFASRVVAERTRRPSAEAEDALLLPLPLRAPAPHDSSRARRRAW